MLLLESHTRVSAQISMAMVNIARLFQEYVFIARREIGISKEIIRTSTINGIKYFMQGLPASYYPKLRAFVCVVDERLPEKDRRSVLWPAV